MEYTNEFLARVYGAYMGCKVRDDLSNEFPTLMGFTQSPSCEKENGTNEDAGWVEVRFEGEWKNRGRGFNQVTLHLTPLPEISDEDAIEVANICGYKKALKSVKLKIGRDCCMGVRRGAFVEQFYVMQEVIDYLRSKGYDTGFAEIPNLIEAGIAIKKQQP